MSRCPRTGKTSDCSCCTAQHSITCLLQDTKRCFGIREQMQPSSTAVHRGGDAESLSPCHKHPHAAWRLPYMTKACLLLTQHADRGWPTCLASLSAPHISSSSWSPARGWRLAAGSLDALYVPPGSPSQRLPACLLLQCRLTQWLQHGGLLSVCCKSEQAKGTKPPFALFPGAEHAMSLPVPVEAADLHQLCCRKQAQQAECTYHLVVSLKGNHVATLDSAPHKQCCLLPCNTQYDSASHAYSCASPDLAWPSMQPDPKIIW